MAPEKMTGNPAVEVSLPIHFGVSWLSSWERTQAEDLIVWWVFQGQIPYVWGLSLFKNESFLPSKLYLTPVAEKGSIQA